MAGCWAGISNGSSPIPTWLPDFYNPQKVGGPMLDLHVHDAHFIRLVCGMPRAVQSVGTMRGEVVERFSTQFLYDPPRIVTATSGVIDQQGRPFTHGYEIYLEEATLFFDYMAIPKRGRRRDAVDGAVEQRQGVAAEARQRRSDRRLRGRVGRSGPCGSRATRPSPLLAGELARDAVVLCQKQTESVRRGKAVKI